MNIRSAMSMTGEPVFFPCGAITLEGVVETPDAATLGPRPAAVVCHPHPLYGGNMGNNVTRALSRAFLDLGMTCLRFNFRGTGRSQGSHSGGEAEIDDVKSALDFILKRKETDAGKVVLAGYSFGCWTALRAAASDPRPSRLIGISPPLDMYDFGFLAKERRPLLLVAGDRDFVCDAAAFEALAARLPGPRTCVTLPGADHFHFGRETKIAGLATEFIGAFPWEEGR